MEASFKDYGIFEVCENSSNKNTFHLRSVKNPVNKETFLFFYYSDLFFLDRKKPVKVLTYSTFSDKEIKKKYKNHEHNKFYLYRANDTNLYIKEESNIPKRFIPESLAMEMLGYDVNMPHINCGIEITIVKLNKDDENKLYEN